jgi:hypothetical protein
MPNYTVTFHTCAEHAMTAIEASTPAEALVLARTLAENPTDLFFERYEDYHPIDDIAVLDENGNDAAGWVGPRLRLELAAPALLEAAKLVIARWEQGDLADAVRQLASAVEEAEGGS